MRDRASAGAHAIASTPAATPEQILRALADPERLAVAGAVARRPGTAAELADEAGIAVTRVRRHLARLAAAGLIAADPDGRTYRLQASALRQAAREIGPSREAGLALGAVDEQERAVLSAYFRGGRLTEIPSKRSKRRVVLERLAQEFDVGVRYPERAVNGRLRRFSDNYAALRRYLVDEDLLSREGGEYWRSGGPVRL